jgi:tetrahydromethanopterin S-methyltransferase subunit G
MEERIIELENKVDELNNRLYDIEKREAGRKVGRLIKNLISLLFLFAIIYGGLKAYNYVKNELPNDIDKKVTEVQDKVIKKNGN